jgi:hypothetical protein
MEKGEPSGVVYLLLLVFGHLFMVAVDLPALASRPERRGERWARGALILVSFSLGLLAWSLYRPVTVWQVLDAIFSPIGTPLFKPPGG